MVSRSLSGARVHHRGGDTAITIILSEFVPFFVAFVTDNNLLENFFLYFQNLDDMFKFNFCILLSATFANPVEPTGNALNGVIVRADRLKILFYRTSRLQR